MPSSDVTPRFLLRQDVSALVRLLAALEGQLLIDGEETVPEWARRLATILARDGALASATDARALRQYLNDLTHRLRYVLGEYDEPRAPQPVP